MSKKVLFVGGGSLGHITPSVAVWESLQEESDVDAYFVCSPSTLDTEYLKRLSLPFSTINAPRLGLSFFWKYPKAVKESHIILDRVNPDIIFSKGGYVSVPMCAAAKKKNIPIVLHESDEVMGRANRLIAKWATEVCTGTPVRKFITEGSKEEGYRITGLQNDRPTLLVIGGSQGAQALNEAVIRNIDELLAHCQVIHVSGHGKSCAEKRDEYFCTAFADEELAHFYAVADIALSRASGNVIAELAANSIPTILVPLRGVGHDHQQKNAEVFSQEDTFALLQQSELDDKLIPTVKKLLHDKQSSTPRSLRLEEELRGRNQQPDNATERIVKIILEVLASTPGPH